MAELIQESSMVDEIIGEYAIPSTTVADAAAINLVVEGERITMSLDPVDNTEKPNLTVIRCKIQRRQILPGENNFSIRFSCIEPSLQFPSNTISPIVDTSNIKMVTSTLQVIPEDWADIWYKDEGGRGKCIQVAVHLVDQENHPVLSKCFQLHYSLVYDNDTRSALVRQDVLHLLGTQKNYMDPVTGIAILCFRIEDVSRNHQGLSFMIRVDADSTIYDVAPAFSPAVSVRSKRGKHSREVVSISSNNLPEATSDHPAFSYSLTRSQEITDIAAIQNALKVVMKWSEAVVQLLHHRRWSVVGYAPLTDTACCSLPYFSNMVNPNDVITSIGMTYNHGVKQHLMALQSFLDSMVIPGGNPIGKSFAVPHQKTFGNNNISSLTSSINPKMHESPTKNPETPSSTICLDGLHNSSNTIG